MSGTGSGAGPVGQRPTPFLRSKVLPLLFIGGLFATLWARRPQQPGPVTAEQTAAVRVSGATMGTTWSATVTGATNAEHVQRTVQDILDQVDDSMSTWKPDSELSRLNASDGTQPVAVSEALGRVLEIAAEVNQASGGAFDITIAPVVDAWGFGPDDPSAAPDADTLAAMLAHVGPDKLVLDPDSGRVSKADPAVRADLSAVAKGYAVDLALEALDRVEHAGIMVEVGGEVRARGVNPDGQPWRVGVERPDGTRQLLDAIPLHDRAMATSGDYRNYREVDGVRVSHTIDPRTGRPIDHGLASVSVLHSSCAHADAWATALNVLGPEAGPTLAEAQGLAALFVIHQDDGFVTRQTSGWPETLPPETP